MDTAQLAVLKTELTTDPLTRGYAAMSDGLAAARLNLRDRPVSSTIPTTTIHQWFIFNGRWSAVEALAVNQNATQPQQEAAKAMIEVCHYVDTLDLSKSLVSGGMGQILTLLQQGSVITNTQRNQVIALASATVSRADELGLPTVAHLDVADARRLP